MNRRRDLLLGCLGAALMLVGDLCLSLIPAASTDSGLFVREAYLNGSYQTWRLPLLLGAGLPGMALIAFGVRGLCSQVRPECGKTRRVMELSGLMYIVSAGALHYLIGSMADWTSVLAPLLGREETAALIAGQYARLTLPSALPTAGMVLFLVSGAWAVAAGKTRLPRRMIFCHAVAWQVVFALIPDIRQLLGAQVPRIFTVIAGRFPRATVFVETMNPAMAKHFQEKSIKGSQAKFTWGIRDGKALAALLPDFRLIEEHPLTEGMAAFVPIYKLLDKLPPIRNLSNRIVVLERR